MIFPGLANAMRAGVAVAAILINQTYLYAGTLSTYSGNTVDCPANAAASGQGLFPRAAVYQTGKLYYELRVNSIVGSRSTGASGGFSTASAPVSELVGTSANSVRVTPDQVYQYNNVTTGTATALQGAGTVEMYCIDTVAGKFWAGRAGVWAQGGNPATGVGGVSITAGLAWAPHAAIFAEANCNLNCTFRFSASQFSYSPPSGFSAVEQGGSVVGSNVPVNTELPAITSADLKVGTVATCSTGTWANSPTGYAYQWMANGVNVGTNQNTYAYQASDVGKVITCRVTATNANGPGTATSNATGAIIAAGATLWKPSDEPTCAYFYDALDPAGYAVSGGKVTQINDKSGLGRHATQTDTNRQCTWGATAFDGVNPGFAFGNRPWYNTGIPGNLDEFSYVFALNCATNYQALLGGPDSNMYHIAFENGGYMLIDSSGETRIATASTPIASDTPTIVVISRRQSDSLFKFRINGTEVGSGFYSKPVNNPATHLLFASRPDGADTLAGQCAYAFGFRNFSGDNAVIQKAEGFIAHKLGLQSILPAGHAYKSSAP